MKNQKSAPSVSSPVMTRCPVSGSEIATGLHCDWDTFSNLADMPGRVLCPSCNQTHAWQLSEAWLRLDNSGEKFHLSIVELK